MPKSITSPNKNMPAYANLLHVVAKMHGRKQRYIRGYKRKCLRYPFYPDAYLTDEVRGKNSLRYEEYIDSVVEEPKDSE